MCVFASRLHPRPHPRDHLGPEVGEPHEKPAIVLVVQLELAHSAALVALPQRLFVGLLAAELLHAVCVRLFWRICP